MSATDLQHLKLVAFDADDLAVVSTHLQDAIVRVGDLAFLPKERRFALIARRFDWESPGDEPRRRLTGLHFERVMGARTQGLERGRDDAPLNLLAITFAEGDAPSGTVRLAFAAGISVELEIECLEARLKDIGPVWAAEARPAHDAERA